MGCHGQEARRTAGAHPGDDVGRARARGAPHRHRHRRARAGSFPPGRLAAAGQRRAVQPRDPRAAPGAGLRVHAVDRGLPRAVRPRPPGPRAAAGDPPGRRGLLPGPLDGRDLAAQPQHRRRAGCPARRAGARVVRRAPRPHRADPGGGGPAGHRGLRTGQPGRDHPGRVRRGRDPAAADHRGVLRPRSPFPRPGRAVRRQLRG
ncbi:Uncharacterised protein [Mycobacteroides abscessus subsp. abscessus]|nr:Uncharacterised protein [Mycobacteroides abscessus subsp. abscessus]